MHIYFFVTANTSAAITATSCDPTIHFRSKGSDYLSLSMSITYILLFFLCLPLHACDARHLSTLDKELETKSHFSIKNDAENGFDSSPKQLPLSNEGNRMGTWLVDDTEKQKERRSTNQRVLKAIGKDSGALQTESLVSVSWHAHEKPKEKIPGFNMDYAPPKTHPPSIN